MSLAVPFGYVAAGAGLILLGIDLALPKGLHPAAVWRVPLRILGAAMTGLTAFWLLVGDGSDAQAAAGFTAFAAFFAAYSLRIDPRVGYVATASFALAAASWAFAVDRASLAPVMTGVSAAFFVGSLALRPHDRWQSSNTLRFSGLVLGSLTALAVFLGRPVGAAWYLLGVSLLFLLELILTMTAGPNTLSSPA